MAPEMRETLLQVRMSVRERTMLTELAELEGLTSSEYVRAFIRQQHASRLGIVTPKPKKKRPK